MLRLSELLLVVDNNGIRAFIGVMRTLSGATVSMTDAPLVTRSSTIRQACPALNAPSIAFLVP